MTRMLGLRVPWIYPRPMNVGLTGAAVDQGVLGFVPSWTKQYVGWSPRIGRSVPRNKEYVGW
jgi:hypothetical protein